MAMVSEEDDSKEHSADDAKSTFMDYGIDIPKNEETELKKVRRRIKNKLSAQESRRRKKEYIDNLEKRNKFKDRENADLKQSLETMEEKMRSMVDEMFKMKQEALNKLQMAMHKPFSLRHVTEEPFQEYRETAREQIVEEDNNRDFLSREESRYHALSSNSGAQKHLNRSESLEFLRRNEKQSSLFWKCSHFPQRNPANEGIPGGDRNRNFRSSDGKMKDCSAQRNLSRSESLECFRRSDKWSGLSRKRSHSSNEMQSNPGDNSKREFFDKNPVDNDMVVYSSENVILIKEPKRNKRQDIRNEQVDADEQDRYNICQDADQALNFKDNSLEHAEFIENGASRNRKAREYGPEAQATFNANRKENRKNDNNNKSITSKQFSRERHKEHKNVTAALHALGKHVNGEKSSLDKDNSAPSRRDMNARGLKNFEQQSKNFPDGMCSPSYISDKKQLVDTQVPREKEKVTNFDEQELTSVNYHNSDDFFKGQNRDDAGIRTGDITEVKDQSKVRDNSTKKKYDDSRSTNLQSISTDDIASRFKNMAKRPGFIPVANESLSGKFEDSTAKNAPTPFFDTNKFERNMSDRTMCSRSTSWSEKPGDVSNDIMPSVLQSNIDGDGTERSSKCHRKENSPRGNVFKKRTPISFQTEINCYPKEGGSPNGKREKLTDGRMEHTPNSHLPAKLSKREHEREISPGKGIPIDNFKNICGRVEPTAVEMMKYLTTIHHGGDDVIDFAVNSDQREIEMPRRPPGLPEGLSIAAGLQLSTHGTSKSQFLNSEIEMSQAITPRLPLLSWPSPDLSLFSRPMLTPGGPVFSVPQQSPGDSKFLSPGIPLPLAYQLHQLNQWNMFRQELLGSPVIPELNSFPSQLKEGSKCFESDLDT
eukprot:Seg1134.5 transcript_id=Seg1134.5/GoldUCD/mRNA.D3Y31 product="Cyclic AMP-responsive element-binding protein 3" protein_id=Seg1134.5/GoldUCD/D3Y31